VLKYNKTSKQKQLGVMQQEKRIFAFFFICIYFYKLFSVCWLCVHCHNIWRGGVII